MRFILLAALLIFTNGYYDISAQTVFTYRSPESSSDTRYDYDNALLKLALDKTVNNYGEYILRASPVMNYARMRNSLVNNELENPMFKQSATNELCDSLDYVNFPIDLGIVGYRVFFVAPAIKTQLESVKTLDELKEYTILQGFGWSDIDILRSEGFEVMEIQKYESLFLMVTNNRGDLLPRGINEIKSEIENHRGLKNLMVNSNLVLHYPLPRFFFTSKGNRSAVNRVLEGLSVAYEDGSLMELWKEHYQESIDFTNLNNRLIISIPNRGISNVDKSYEKYFYKIRN